MATLQNSLNELFTAAWCDPAACLPVTLPSACVSIRVGVALALNQCRTKDRQPTEDIIATLKDFFDDYKKGISRGSYFSKIVRCLTLVEVLIRSLFAIGWQVKGVLQLFVAEYVKKFT